MNSRRQLRNLKLTWRFHGPYLGLWLAIGALLLIVANVLAFVLVLQHFEGIPRTDPEVYGAQMAMRGRLFGFLIVETLLMILALGGLAMFTAHRIAGPYVRLRRVLSDIRSGRKDVRLAFRKHDQLDDLAAEFNATMDRLLDRSDRSAD